MMPLLYLRDFVVKFSAVPIARGWWIVETSRGIFVVLIVCGGIILLSFPGAAKDAPQLVLPIGHTKAVTSVAFSPDGRYILSGSNGTTAKLWEVATGREVRSFSGHQHHVWSVAFSPDGHHVLSGSWDGWLNLWEVSTGQVTQFPYTPNGVRSVAFSSDGYYALSGSVDGSIRLWNVSTKQEIRSFSGHTGRVNSVAFSPDDRFALSGSDDKTMKYWHVSTGKERRSFSVRGRKAPVNSVAFSSDGRYALADLDGRTLKLWNLFNGREVRSFSGRTNLVNSVAFSPDGSYVIAGCGDGTLKRWETGTGRKIYTLGHGSSVLSVAFSPDGLYAISGAEDGTLKLWDMSKGREVRSFSGHTKQARSAVFSPDGRYAISGLKDKTLRLWDVATGRELHSLSGHTGAVASVAFGPGGNYALSGSDDKTMKLWDVSTGGEIRSFSGHVSRHRGGVTSVAFSPDGEYALSGSTDKTVKLWNVSTGQNIHSFSGHADAVMSVTFSPDGHYALSGSDDKTMKLWDVITGRKIRTFFGHTYQVWSVAFSPDSSYVLSGSYDRTMKLWDVKTGQEIRTFSGHSDAIYSTVFSSDGRYALSSSADKTMKLWEIGTGKELRSFSGHTWQVTSAAFSPDDRHALSSSWDNSVRLWEIATGKLLLIRLHLDEVDWVASTPDGRFDGSSDAIKLLHYAKDNKSIPLESLFDKFYTPGLVAQVMSGEELAPDAPDIRKGIEIPPLVRIVSPEAGQILKVQTVDVVVEAVDQGGGLEDIRLYHENKRLEGEGKGMGVRPSAGVQRIFTVTMMSGMNTLRATAYSWDRTEANPFEITIEVKIPEAKADLYVVAVGINTYKSTNHNLNYAVADARAISHSLSKHGEGIFREVSPQTVFDEQATRSGIEAALRRVERDARPEDVFIFFYSGHGVMSEGSEQEPADFHLVPTNMTQMYGNDVGLAERGVSAAQLRDMCQQIKARKQLLILDACQAGALADTFAIRGAAEEKAMAQLARSAGVAVLAATGAEQLAREFKALEHGLFTYALLQGMEGSADGSPKDGKVTVSELSGYVQDQIPELSKRHRGQEQWPFVYILGQDFPVAVP
ncbi:caspase family protein [Candidatus Poribacteria bacterium]